MPTIIVMCPVCSRSVHFTDNRFEPHDIAMTNERDQCPASGLDQVEAMEIAEQMNKKAAEQRRQAREEEEKAEQDAQNEIFEETSDPEPKDQQDNNLPPEIQF